VKTRTHNHADKERQIVAVDLFCGAGGLTAGLSNAGISVLAGYDLDEKCRFPYEHNNSNSKFYLKSVSDVSGEEVSALFGEAKYTLLSGCAPCQTFSAINPKAGDDDERWWLLLDFARIVNEVLPSFVTMENVPGLEKQEVFKQFLDVLAQNNYCVDYQVINCSDYGIPQNRRRLVLMASRVGEIALPNPSEISDEKKTVRDTIKDLCCLDAGEASVSDSLHYAKDLMDINLQRIRASKPGGSWRDWEEKLKCECHKRTSGNTYTAVYGRMEWDKPSPTITTQFYNYGSGRFGHPDQDRALSFREGALLQTFPPDYEFFEADAKIGNHALGDLIGNAVPVDLGKTIGSAFVDLIEHHVN